MNQLQSAFYTRSDKLFLLEHSKKQRRYILAVRDMPAEERPREKLIAHGPSALTLAELLAVILNTGTKKEEVLAMTNRILKEYGQKSILTWKDAKKLSADLDIPMGKALQIIACGELGRRLFDKNENSSPTIRTASDVFSYVVDMQNLKREHLRGLYLNAHYKLIHDETISIGTVDASLIHPREVFKPAVEYGAVGVILVHNHPSGIVNPSPSDRAITDQLIKTGEMLGIDLIDHVIVTKDTFISIPASYKGEGEKMHLTNT